MEVGAIVAIAVGCGIVVFTSLLFALTNKFTNRTFYTTEKLFFVKKWLFIGLVMVLNIGGCVMVYYTKNLQVVIYVLIALKSKDILMALLFTVRNIWAALTSFKKSTNVDLESGTKRQVIAFVPTYRESLYQAGKTVDSIIKNKTRQEKSSYEFDLLVCLVSDGSNDYKPLIDEVICEKHYVYTSWKGVDVLVKTHYGKRNGVPVLLMHKATNHGKKDSIILCNDIFNYIRSNIPDKNLKIRDLIKSEIGNVFKDQVDNTKFDYIFSTDGDTMIDESGIGHMIQTLETRKAVACCGVVNVDKTAVHLNAFWSNLQNFQYLYGQFMRRSNEDVFNQVLCLPGCISMFKVDETSATALKMYSTLPDKGDLIETCVQFMGTDRRYTSSLVYTNGSAKIVFDDRVHAYTVPPENFKRFVNQRKRWCQNTLFNSINNIIGKNVNFVLRFFNLVDVLRSLLVYFRLFNTVYFLYLLSSGSSQNILDIVPFIVILSYPPVVFFVYSIFVAHLRKQILSLVLSYVVNRIFTFSSSVVVFTSMLWNIGVDTWSSNFDMSWSS